MDPRLRQALRVVHSLQAWLDAALAGPDRAAADTEGDHVYVSLTYTTCTLSVAVGDITVWCNQVDNVAELTATACLCRYQEAVERLAAPLRGRVQAAPAKGTRR